MLGLTQWNWCQPAGQQLHNLISDSVEKLKKMCTNPIRKQTDEDNIFHPLLGHIQKKLLVIIKKLNY